MAYGETYEQFIEKFNNPRIKKHQMNAIPHNQFLKL